MSEPSEKLAKGLLSAFDLGPSWARGDAPPKKYDEARGDDRGGDRHDRGRQRDDRGGDRRDRQGGGGGGGGGRDFQQRRGGGGGGGGGNYDRGGRQQHGGGRDFGGPRELPQPAEGVRVTLSPSVEAVHLVVREIHHVARVYSLYDVAQILLAGRERYRLHFHTGEKRPPFFRGRNEPSLWLNKEEAIAHFWQSEAVGEFYESEEVEGELPTGNFQVVARCGMSGEWLGPPNFHGYQTALRRLHRERFSHMPFEVYASRVRTERGEEAVNAWLDTMRKRVRWRAKGSGENPEENAGVWSFDRADIERDFATRLFDAAFEETRDAELPGDVPAKNLSFGLLACVRIAGSHARKHPAILIPAVCRMLEGEHLAVFKREGKLFTGPARPHPLSADAKLAERPAAMVAWMESQEAPKLGKLWESMLPEGETEPGKEWLADLFWLLTQGHVLLFADDSLVVPRRRGLQPAAATAEGEAAKAPKKKKRKKRRKPRARRVRVVNPAKMIRGISRMSPSRLKTLRGDALIWKRRLIRRGRIASLVEEEK